MFLILMGSAFSVSFTVTVQAEKKLQSIDAIWDAVGVVTQQPQMPPKNSVRNTPKADAKLTRQRAAWRAKWEAQQRSKALAKQQPNKTALKKPTKPLTKAQYQWRFKQAQLKKQQEQRQRKQAQAAPKQLTRAQYQWRFKQAQLKKQQQINHAKSAKRNKLFNNKKATFKQNKTPAIFKKLPTNIASKLRSKGVKTSGMSAYVQDVNSSQALLGHNDQISRVPASVMKLITSYAALGVLGPNYRWPLEVYTKGQIRNGTLQGDLIIKGKGSPEFKTTDLRKVLHGIRSKGIRNVSGRILFDNSYFNAPRQSAASFDKNKLSAYNAKPDALLFNERLSSFKVRALKKSIRITPELPIANLKIVNKVRKSKRSCRVGMSARQNGHQTIVTFTGRFARRCGTRTLTKVVSNPANMIYGAMQAYWKRDVGGTLNTRFAVGKVPAGSRRLLTTYSRTLAQILPEIDKDSNNVMARQLLLSIGAKRAGQGTERNGANAIGVWLASRGLHFPELRIENGSGLSRNARISARHVGDLLVDAYRSPFRDYLMRSLAVAGVDGTMKRRLKRSPVRGRGFFKTGTLRDVRSIAGYVKAADGKTYVMAILHNDPRAKKRSLPAHDKLIEWVYQGGKSRLAMR